MPVLTFDPDQLVHAADVQLLTDYLGSCRRKSKRQDTTRSSMRWHNNWIGTCCSARVRISVRF